MAQGCGEEDGCSPAERGAGEVLLQGRITVTGLPPLIGN